MESPLERFGRCPVIRLAAYAILGGRWKVERTFAWLGNFHHRVVRYDHSLTIYSAFFHIACIMIVIRRVLK